MTPHGNDDNMITRIDKPRKDGKVLVTYVFPLSGRTLRKLRQPAEAYAEWDKEHAERKAAK